LTQADRALSAKTDNRPEFQRLIRDSAKGLFDVIIVWRLDRFARNRYDSAHYKAILRKNGVKVISATEPISEDATGILLESLLEGMGEYYSAELSEKVKRGLTENALQCKWNNGSRPVGYFVDDEKKLQIDPLTAPIILEAFKKYSEGEKVVEIVKFLADSGIKSYRGTPLRIDAVQRMFKNRVYIGEYKYGEHITPGGVPQIVPFDLFQQVGERMAKNKKAPARFKAEDEYLLTTKLHCGKCEAFMVGESGTSRSMKVHRYYKCVTAKKRKGCNKKSAQKDWIEDLVVAQAVKMLENDDILNKITDMIMDLQKQENITLPLLKKQLAEVEKGITNMLNAIQSGVLTESTKGRLDELEVSKSEIEVKILQEELHKPLLTKKQILFWLHKFRGIDANVREPRQRLIDTFVNAVYLYDDRVVLTFNYKDGSKTVTMGDVEGGFGSDLATLSAGYCPKKNTLPIFVGEVFFFVFPIGL
jgi:DNA invertase Pin-like site-specific DNA recombinase